MRESNLPGAFVGAVGVILQGYVRTTNDVDLMVYVPIEPASAIHESLGKAGFSPRIADAVDFAERNHVLLMRHDKTRIGVDVALGRLPLEQEIAQSADRPTVSGHVIPVASVDALCVMKIFAARPHDVQDVRALLQIHPDVNREWIMGYVRQYAELLDAPDRITIGEKLLGIKPDRPIDDVF
jgi:hypothetical protein